MGKKIHILWLLCAMAASLPAQGPRERLYVQTDKEFYLAGEDLLLNVRGVDEVFRPLSLSRVAYVELLGDADNAVRVKVELSGGRGSARVPLPARLASGTYRLVAYTRWMRNEGEAAFFRKDVEVFNPLRYLPAVDRVSFDEGQPAAPASGSAGNIQAATGKAEYGRREKVTLSLQGVPADAGVSVSVTRADGSPAEAGMESYKRRLPAATGTPGTEYQPELEGLLVDAAWVPDGPGGGNPVRPNLSLQGDVLHYYAGQPQGGGRFTFRTPPLAGMKEVVAGADGAGHLELLTPFAAALPDSLRPMRLCRGMEEDLSARCLGVQLEGLAPRDTLRAYGGGVEGYNRFVPRWSYDLDQYRRFPTFEETFLEFMPGVSTARKGEHRLITIFDNVTQNANQGNTLVMLDGVTVTDHEALLAYNPRLVKWVDVYTGSYVFGDQFYNGILSLRTPHRTLAGFRLPESSVVAEYEGVQPAARLPQDEALPAGGKLDHQPDLRHTLYWNPELKPGEESVEFTTSDLCGTFIVTVEGLTTDGKILYGRTTFRVNP